MSNSEEKYILTYFPKKTFRSIFINSFKILILFQDKLNGRDSYPFISSVRVPLNPCENDVLSLK